MGDDVIGREDRWLERPLTVGRERELHERRAGLVDEVATLRGEHDSAKNRIKSFAKWAEEKTAELEAIVAEDPSQDSVRRLRALRVATGRQKHLEGLTRLKSAIRSAEEELHALDDVLADGAEFERIELELRADYDRLEVHYVDPETNEAIDGLSRAMTDDERQMAFSHGDERTHTGAPSTVQ